MDNIEIIRKNNEAINESIKKLIRIKGVNFVTQNEDGSYQMDEDYKRIINMEIRKLIKLYQAEFPHLSYEEKTDYNVDIFELDEADGRGYENKVLLATGTAKFFENLESTYSIDENGRVTFDRNSQNKEKRNVNLYNDNTGALYLLDINEKIENNCTFGDYFTYCYLNGYKDIDFLRDILPHETMHVFGFKGGAYEGATEEFTREIAQKYSLRNIPFAHQEETRIMQKIEKIIGRKNLSNGAFTSSTSVEDHKYLSYHIDEAIKDGSKMSDQDLGLYLKYIEADDNCFKYRNDDKKRHVLREELKKSQEALESALDKFITQNPNKVNQLGEDIPLFPEELQKRERMYTETIQIQEKELEELERLITALEDRSKDPQEKSKEELIDGIKEKIIKKNELERMLKIVDQSKQVIS